MESCSQAIPFRPSSDATMALIPNDDTAPSLRAEGWLKAPPLLRVFELLSMGGGTVRVIGGAVRNALLGVPVSDIDLATDLTPETVIERVTKAGLAVYPTGLDHGTVTVVADGAPFEVTTLRRDVETDGRRAVVAFTEDWHEDALRRDFTINALSCDVSGKVYDSVGGLEDLAARRIRFIGKAEDRIREDYLRILRFFRFNAAYGAGEPDARGLAACLALKSGLTQLSAERIGNEIMKLCATPRAADIAAIMQATASSKSSSVIPRIQITSSVCKPSSRHLVRTPIPSRAWRPWWLRPQMKPARWRSGCACQTPNATRFPPPLTLTLPLIQPVPNSGPRPNFTMLGPSLLAGRCASPGPALAPLPQTLLGRTNRSWRGAGRLLRCPSLAPTSWPSASPLARASAGP